MLLVAIAVNAALFRPIDRVAAWLLAPSAAWVASAAVVLPWMISSNERGLAPRRPPLDVFFHHRAHVIVLSG